MTFFKLLSLSLALAITFSSSLFSHGDEYHVNEYHRDLQNPGGLKTTDDNDLGSATVIMAGANTIGTFSEVIKLPSKFDFDFAGKLVTKFKVSNSGILTFDTDTDKVIDNNNVKLPSDKIPDKSICIWGLNLTGAQTGIFAQTYGTAPNRQYWITFFDNRGNKGYSVWSIVLEETTHKVHIVDQAYAANSDFYNGGLTLGIQLDSEEFINVNGSPKLYSYSSRSLGTSNNEFYTFLPSERPAYQTEISEFLSAEFPNMATAPYEIKCKFKNVGGEIVKTLEANYQIDDGDIVKELITNIFIPTDDYEVFSFETKWLPESAGSHTVKTWISKVNSNDVGNVEISNNISSIKVSPQTINKIDAFLNGVPVIKQISTASDGLHFPTDLDFYPDFSLNELWVINKKIENTGGSTTTYYNVGENNQTAKTLKDVNSWHFMCLPTGIAFSDNSNFGNSPGVLDANHNGGANPFTGPSLWSSDLTIYAQKPGTGGNGSHLDMLHESPLSQGIAHESWNAFWIFDGHNSDIVRYDFVKGHGNGNGYHDDGIVKRYSDIQVKRDPNENAVSHLVLDKDSGWLYVIDNGNQRVFRMDINTGDRSSKNPTYNTGEQKAEYYTMTGYKTEMLIESGLNSPAGIDIIQDRMIISDYETGDIYIYEITESGINKLGTIKTNKKGINGIKISPDGDIYYVNTLDNTVSKISPDPAASVFEGLNLLSSISPNPSQNNFNINLNFKNNLNNIELNIYDINSKLIKSLGTFNTFNNSLSLAWDGTNSNGEKAISGTYLLMLSSDKSSKTIKLMLNR